MDSRIATTVAITAKRRLILTYFNDVLEDSMWSLINPIKPFHDRKNLALETTNLNPLSSLQKIDEIRAELSEKSHYWDEGNKYRRAVLMGLFDINAQLIDIHKMIEAASPAQVISFLTGLDNLFLELKELAKTHYEKVFLTLQPIFNLLSEFKMQVPPAPTCEFAPPTEEKVALPAPPAIEESNLMSPALHPLMTALWQSYMAASALIQIDDKTITDAALKKHPVLTVAKKALRQLHKYSQTHSLSVFDMFPLPETFKTLEDYQHYFATVLEWLKNQAVCSQGIELETKEIANPVPASIVQLAELSSPKKDTSEEHKLAANPLSPRLTLMPAPTQTAEPETKPGPSPLPSFWQRYVYLRWGLMGLGAGALIGSILVTSGMNLAMPAVIVGISTLSGSAVALICRKSLSLCCEQNKQDVTPIRHSSIQLSSLAKSIMAPHAVKNTTPVTTLDVYNAMKALVLPNNKIERNKFFNFWNVRDNEETLIRQKMRLSVDKQTFTLPESIGSVILLIRQAHSASERAKVPTLAMQSYALLHDAITLGDKKEIYHVTATNLADVIEDYGFKKTLCTILAYRYINLANKVDTLQLLLKAIERSPDFSASIPVEKVGDSAALRSALGARVC